MREPLGGVQGREALHQPKESGLERSLGHPEYELVDLFGSGLPDPKSYALSCAFALLFTTVGYFWFMRTRKAFADVL